jgi:bifunctional DNase/RNase
VTSVLELEVLAIEPEPSLAARSRQSRPEASVLLLRETGGSQRILPIHIGWAEAQAIEWALAKMHTPRPMTHDLLKNVIDELGARVERIVVTELNGGTFYAEIAISLAGEVRAISARPSDAIALALRVEVPIFADEDVLAEAGVVPQQDEEQQEQVVEEFRAFIDQVNPDDFAGS